MSYSESAYEHYNKVRALAARAAGEFPSSNNLRLQKPTSSSIFNLDVLIYPPRGDETRASLIRSRKRELRGWDEGRLVDPTRRTGELDCLFGPARRMGELDVLFDPTRRTGELDDLLDPTRPFGELDVLFGPTRPFGELDGAFGPTRPFGELDDTAL
ncbi:hypothetical protein DY000_02013387 [Brassica cretica]|uniref:Uncharacterized protein n=1 Tax=Brassica cretica TaxID=69181 RepID=A0ABQ7D3Q2_BRACR|nr:hypothetical protein DY000_02013387 [Brassica cretica]